MKKSKLVLFALPLLLLTTGCGTGSSSTSTLPSISEDDDDDIFGKDYAKVHFYISAAYTDPKLAYVTQEVVVGGKLTKPEGIPVNPDAAFSEFLGWSNLPIITSQDQLWDFENDTIPEYIPGLVYRMYGIWA